MIGITYVLLVLPLSIDALIVGITYGLRKIKVPLSSKLIISFFSIFYFGISLFAGKMLAMAFSEYTSKIIGIILLDFIGICLIGKALFERKRPKQLQTKYFFNNTHEYKTLAKIAIKSLGVTIHVIKDPASGDIDGSGIIDRKESLMLGFALSVDSIGVGIGSAMVGMYGMLIPFLVGAFQLFFLCVGMYFGKRFFRYVPSKVVNFLPGAILIVISILKICS